MKHIEWHNETNALLKKERDVAFEDVIFAIDNDQLIDVVEYHNKDKYNHQRVFVVEIEGDVYLVPYVEDDENIFLKTIIPSRKATKKYLQER